MPGPGRFWRGSRPSPSGGAPAFVRWNGVERRGFRACTCFCASLPTEFGLRVANATDMRGRMGSILKREGARPEGALAGVCSDLRKRRTCRSGRSRRGIPATRTVIHTRKICYETPDFRRKQHAPGSTQACDRPRSGPLRSNSRQRSPVMKATNQGQRCPVGLVGIVNSENPA